MNMGARAWAAFWGTLPWVLPGVLGQLGGVSAPFLPEAANTLNYNRFVTRRDRVD
jgi:hypothetical protein